MMKNRFQLQTYDQIKDIPKPYSYKKVKTGWFASKFVVLYEKDTAVYEWTGDEGTLKGLVDTLNTVYLVGAADQISRSMFGR
jgi:hypothetical protein